MMITAHFHGILADWVGTPSAVFDLGVGATVADLMQAIGRNYRRNMPEQLWDRTSDSFNRQVRAQGAVSVYTDLDMPLEKEAEITFMLMIAGG